MVQCPPNLAWDDVLKQLQPTFTIVAEYPEVHAVRVRPKTPNSDLARTWERVASKAKTTSTMMAAAEWNQGAKLEGVQQLPPGSKFGAIPRIRSASRYSRNEQNSPGPASISPSVASDSISALSAAAPSGGFVWAFGQISYPLSAADRPGASAPPVIVAVLDSGIDLKHPALLPKLWTNAKEEQAPNDNIDNDNNGYVDDVHGYDFSGAPAATLQDKFGHGTHVAGIIAADPNIEYNVVGVAGLLPNVKVMAVKFLDDKGEGDILKATGAILYTRDVMIAEKKKNKNVRMIINASWATEPGTSATQLDSLRRAIALAEAKGILFVAAAGNGLLGQSIDTPTTDVYPAGFRLPAPAGTTLPPINIITVGATDRAEHWASYANYGATQVHIAAPGGTGFTGPNTSLSAAEDIWSTLPLPTGAGPNSGTSMAAAFVSGVAAYAWSHPSHQNDAAGDLRDFLLKSARPVADLSSPILRCQTHAVISLIALGGTYSPAGSAIANASDVCPVCKTGLGGNVQCIPVIARPTPTSLPTIVQPDVSTGRDCVPSAVQFSVPIMADHPKLPGN